MFTVSVGASLFDGRFGLAARRPAGLVAMPTFAEDQIDASVSHGDVLIQVAGTTESGCLAALRRVAADLRASAVLRWSMSGFAGVEARNLMGFSEGQGNPLPTGATGDSFPWIDAREQPWAAGASYLVVRLIAFDTAAWDRTPLSSQEFVIGRRKISGDRLASDSAHDSHVGRLHPPAGDGVAMVRRSYNFADGLHRQGLVFVAHQRSLRDGFLLAQQRLAGEKLHDYATTFGGGFYLTLPGLADSTRSFFDLV